MTDNDRVKSFADDCVKALMGQLEAAESYLHSAAKGAAVGAALTCPDTDNPLEEFEDRIDRINAVLADTIIDLKAAGSRLTSLLS